MKEPVSLPTIRGLDLRSLLVLILVRSGGALSVEELVNAVARAGFSLAGRPGKSVSDALRWELRRGRVMPQGRGVYRAGYVARTTRRRMEERVAQTRSRGGTRAYRRRAVPEKAAGAA